MGTKLGKIDLSFFESSIFNHVGAVRKEVLAGPDFGVDVSLVRLPNGLAMASTSDPLSLIPSLGLEESAWLSVHLMANDMATTGLAPQYGQFVLNLPATFSKEDFKRYWLYIHRFSTEIGMAITGGHTGFVEGQNSTIAGGGTFIAVGQEEQFRLSSKAEEGDVLLMTKQCALSSSAILALSFPETVKNATGAEIHQRACESFYQTSSLADALAAVEGDSQRREVTAMHDVTEGGVLGAVYEMAFAAGLGVKVYDEQLPIDDVQHAVCQLFELDPRYCIGAGSMIIACKADAVRKVTARLSQKGILCSEIGVLTSAEKGRYLLQDGIASPLMYEAVDPYWAAFFEAINRGWR